MKNKSKLFKIKLLLFASIFILVIGAWSFLFYFDIKNQQKRLYETVETQSFLIVEAVQHYQGNNKVLSKDSTILFISQLLDHLYGNFNGFGETGEFVLGSLKKDSLVFLSHLRYHKSNVPLILSIKNLNKSNPLLYALTKPTGGTLIAKDYRGKLVIAAY